MGFVTSVETQHVCFHQVRMVDDLAYQLFRVYDGVYTVSEYALTRRDVCYINRNQYVGFYHFRIVYKLTYHLHVVIWSANVSTCTFLLHSQCRDRAFTQT